MADQILGVESKTFWRNSRMLLWSGIVAVAGLDLFNLIEIPKEASIIVFPLYLGAAWVLAYAGLEWLRKR
jgi:hypothetical protein